MESILVGISLVQLCVFSVMLWFFVRRGSGSEMRMQMKADLDQISVQLHRRHVEESERIRSDIANSNKGVREELSQSIHAMSHGQLRQLDVMSKQWGQVSDATDKRMREMQLAVEQRLGQIQQMTQDRLESMRATVEEKLQGTLERRLGESFKQVGDRLEQVQRGLGEMQSLATGVGDLKRVLTNVKTRGTWGEMQLSMLLEQILTPEQYEANAKIGRRANDMVEFAVKLPGRDDEGSTVYLPIDSKFPQEAYLRILTAQEVGDVEGMEVGRRELEQAIKTAARDIRDKYIQPPVTTDFGILFLPTEGLFAEVLRISGMVERMQNEFRVTIAGPTTLAALLNSLQMGFRSLAIQKRSSEVWKVLGAVKSEFGKFGDLLDGVHKKLNEAAHRIEDASKKSRTIETKLRGVEALPTAEALAILGTGESGVP